jgi:hypothetical protein
MGIDDRDYMRDRYRKRRGLGGTRWNDKKGRSEHDGPWFSEKNQGFGYQKNRWRRKSSGAQRWRSAVASLIPILCLLTYVIPMWRDMKRSGWIPDTDVEISFPESGSVTVNHSIDPRSATSSLKVVTDMGNAVIQLYDPATDTHVISVYVRRGDEVTIPVPPGTYRMQVIEGDKWHGPEKYFGSTTTFETVSRKMTFSDGHGSGIDLHRSRAGNLHTRTNFSAPQPLN